jgi:subtilisin family serine protease
MTASGVANTPPARPGLQIGLSPENPGNSDEITAYSSRGPRRGDNRLKPDMTAPAENVTVINRGTGNGVASFNGTSSSAPHVAGAMALLRQITNSADDTPDWTMEELKALMLNSATGNPFVGGINSSLRYGLGRAGVGRLNLAPAGGIPTAVAMSTDAEYPVSVSFGVLEVPVTQTLEFDKEFEVINKATSGGSRTFDLSFDYVTPVPGVTVSFPNGSSVTVPENSSTLAIVRVTVDGAALRHARDLSTTPRQVFVIGPPPTFLPRRFIAEAGWQHHLHRVRRRG